MLFNSFEFLFLFLPFCLFVFISLNKQSKHETAMIWLVFCSLFFYGWWSPAYLILIAGSMVFNYILGQQLSSVRRYSKLLLWIGVITNLSFLGYYKYANFFVDQLNFFSGTSFHLDRILLPLAISFFTFQQIAFLVDSYRHETKEFNFLHYSLFVTFFPQLIAGPIVHHKEILPQFLQKYNSKIELRNIAIGLSIFAIGFFKKTVIADGIAPYSNVFFNSTLIETSPSFFVAWGGSLAYTLQLYFDFSGYSDMAIGLARMFGIILPLNFYSPYKAINISEFWRRWHITLSNFLRDYVYIALGGNRNGSFNRYRNLFLTMFLGGLWHGAGWNFALWGALHGSYLIIHQGWGRLFKHKVIPIPNSIKVFSAWLLTFIAVVVGWVFFRATSLDSAVDILIGMSGANGFAIPNAISVRLGIFGDFITMLGVTTFLGGGESFLNNWLWILIILPTCLILPNTQDLFVNNIGSLSNNNHLTAHTFWPLHALCKKTQWKLSNSWAWLISFAFILGILSLAQVSEFLYFQF